MPPKQYDFSAFDKPVTQIEKESPKYDFSAFDEEKPVTLSEQTEEVGLTPIGEKDIQKFEQLKAPAAGYVAGKAVQKGLEKTGELAEKAADWAATNIGQTSPEQLKLIKENFKTFKAMDPMARVNAFLDKSRNTNLSVNEMYDEAEKLLVDKKITPDEYKNIVQSAILEKDKYGRPTFARPVSQSEIQKAGTRVLSNLRDEAIKEEEKMLNEFARLKAEEAVKKADFEYKITNATKQELPKSIESEIRSSIINNVKSNPQESGFRGLGSQLFGDYDYKIGKEIEILQTPLVREFPFLEGTSMDPKEDVAFKKILDIPGTADITGDKLQQYMREARSKAFLENGNLSDKPSAAFGSEVRKKISSLSPEAGRLMEAENIELSKLESLENAGYIKRKGTGRKTAVEMTDTERNKLVKDLATSFKGSTPTDVAENLQVLKDYMSPDQFKKLKLATVKLAEQNAGDIEYLPSSILNKLFSSLKIRKVSRGLATLPQSIALNLPKTAAAGKFAMKALPIIGAGVGGVAAQAAEEALSPESSGALPTELETEDRRNAPIPVNLEELDKIKSTYWFEKGYTPEQQQQKARLASFKEGLPAQGKIEEMPSAYEKPEIKQYKEQVMTAKKAGALAPTYVEAPKQKVLKADNPAEIASVAQALQTSPDKASQEYGRVLSQIVDAAPREKESILFGLNQQPAFRDLVRKLKGE